MPQNGHRTDWLATPGGAIAVLLFVFVVVASVQIFSHDIDEELKYIVVGALLGALLKIVDRYYNNNNKQE